MNNHKIKVKTPPFGNWRIGLVILRLAYLSRIRNIPSGLHMRSLILKLLSTEKWTSTSEISEHVPVTSATVLYHLRNMEREDIVQFNDKIRKWKRIETHQIPLSEFMKSSKKQRRQKQ